MNEKTKIFIVMLILLFICLWTIWADEASLSIDYYYLHGCRSCQDFLDNTIPALEEKLTVNITVNHFDILDTDNYRECEKRLKAAGIKLDSFPVIFVGKHVLAGEDEITQGIESTLLSLKNGTRQHPESSNSNIKELALSCALTVLEVFNLTGDR